MTRFKELCLDVVGDGGAMGRFWAGATGCTHDPGAADEPGDVIGTEEGMGIALCPVPEPKTVKHRVHLDVHTGSVEALLALGATRAPGYPDDEGWTVLLDPEGGELCAFVRPEPLPAYLTYELGVDAVDPERIARWWAGVFGVEAANEGEPWWWVPGVPGMPFESIVFAPVPEPKTVKNRIHWDVYGEVPELLGRGATVLAVLPGWTVLADPEGNEFCVFA